MVSAWASLCHLFDRYSFIGTSSWRILDALCLIRACLPGLGGTWLHTARWIRQTYAGSRCIHVRRPHYYGHRSFYSLREEWRAAQGHNRGNGDCVKKCGRDDVNPQLKYNRRILRAIGSGWRPLTPLNRGVSGQREDVAFLTTCLQPADCGVAEPDCAESETDQSADEGVPQREEVDDCNSDHEDDAGAALCVKLALGTGLNGTIPSGATLAGPETNRRTSSWRAFSRVVIVDVFSARSPR